MKIKITANTPVVELRKREVDAMREVRELCAQLNQWLKDPNAAQACADLDEVLIKYAPKETTNASE